MVVVVLSDCPPKLRGDMTKWLFEISTGVYVGDVSARVRDELWSRICENIKNGRASMVFSAEGEQGLDYRVHNTTWTPVDLDGIKLMRHPLPGNISDSYHFDDTPYRQAKMAGQRSSSHRSSLNADGDFCILDLETDGLSCTENRILEAASIRIRDWTIESTWHALVRNSGSDSVPEEISSLTGITDSLIREEGKPVDEVMDQLLAFVGNDRVVCHNRVFDYAFLQTYCKRAQKPIFRNPGEDTMILAKRALHGLKNFKLETVADYYGIDTTGHHRALTDCYITYGILKLKGK